MSERAELLVGRPAEDDWDIDPTRHAGELEKRAPELARELAGDSFSLRAKGYKALDEQAIAASGAHRGRMKLAIRLSLAAAGFAAGAIVWNGVLAPLTNLTPEVKITLARAMIMIQVLLVMSSAWIVWEAGREGTQQQWRETRADAELARIGLFTQLMADAAARKDAALGQQALAYARRFLWRSQLAFFEMSAAKHETRSAGRQNWRKFQTGLSVVVAALALTLGLGALAALLAPDTPIGVFHTRLGGIESLFTAIGIMTSGLVASQSANELLYQDRTNARRYRATADELAAIGGKTWLSPSEAYLAAEAAALAGDPAPGGEWVRSVVTALTAEHRQWMSEQKAAELRQAIAGIKKI